MKQVREMKSEDIEQVLELYHRFATQYVGLARRHRRDYSRLIRKKENENFVALDEQGKIVGYVSSRFEKRNREGSIAEIVVDPNQDFQQTAKQLVDKAYNTLLKRKPAIIFAGSLRNPNYADIFPAMGFFSTESKGVLMYAVLDTPKLLDDITPLIVSRLEKTRDWNGLLQIDCEGHNLFVNKDSENTRVIVWTNQTADFKIALNRDLLTKLLLSIADPIEANQKGQLEVETIQNKTATNHLLRVLFPKKQFLIMDYW